VQCTTLHAFKSGLASAIATADDADSAAAAVALSPCNLLFQAQFEPLGSNLRKEWLIHQNDLSTTPSHHSLLLLTIMNARAQKRSAADDNCNPLLYANILQRVLDYNVGPGHWYFISTVSSLWKDVYERVTSKCSKETPGISLKMTFLDAMLANSKRSKRDPGIKMTLLSAIFASTSRLKLVHSSCLYCLMNIGRLEYLVGWYADKATLMAALALTLVRINSDILTGAVRSGDLSKVIWLYTEQHCKLTKSVLKRSGAVVSQ
jgi:hypothetical protein